MSAVQWRVSEVLTRFILDGTELRQVVLVLQDPELAGDKLSYTVKIIGKCRS